MVLRKVLIMLLCLGLFVSAGSQQRKLLEFESREVNLDTLRFDSDSVLVSFVAVNVSPTPVTVLDVHSSCGCLTGTASHRAIGLGGKAVVKAWFKPRSLHGEQSRHLTVVATDGRDQVLSALTVKAFVQRDLSEGEIRFPEHLGEGLRTEFTRVYLTMDSAGDYLLRIPFYNDTDAPVTVSFEGPSRLKLYAPLTIGPRSREDLRGIYNARWIRRGREVKEILHVKVNSKEVIPIEITRVF